MIRQVSQKQSVIKAKLNQAYREIDLEREPICEGCGNSKNLPLSHAHIIGQGRCKQIGKPELIYDKENIVFLCMGDSISCHFYWDNGTDEQKLTLLNVRKMLWFVAQHDKERFLKFSENEAIHKAFME